MRLHSSQRFVNGWSIRRKLTAVVITTTLFGLLGASAVMTFLQVNRYRQDMRDNLNATADLVGANSEAALEFEDSKVATETLAGLRTGSSIIGACLFLTDGKVLAKFSSAAAVETCDPFTHQREGFTWKKDSAVVVRSIRLNGRSVGTILIRASIHDLNHRVHVIVIGVLVIVAASLAGALCWLPVCWELWCGR